MPDHDAEVADAGATCKRRDSRANRGRVQQAPACMPLPKSGHRMLFSTMRLMEITIDDDLHSVRDEVRVRCHRWRKLAAVTDWAESHIAGYLKILILEPTLVWICQCRRRALFWRLQILNAVGSSSSSSPCEKHADGSVECSPNSRTDSRIATRPAVAVGSPATDIYGSGSTG